MKFTSQDFGNLNDKPSKGRIDLISEDNDDYPITGMEISFNLEKLTF